jgi:hypothetical protein
VELRVADHLTSPEKDWTKFDRELKNPRFTAEASKQARKVPDPKLRKYIRNFGTYSAEKDFVAEVKSRTSSKYYKVKRLPNGRLACGCRDWQYHHSVRTSDCDHIKMLRKSGALKR